MLDHLRKLSVVERARTLAKLAHEGQKRDGGLDYFFFHLEPVANTAVTFGASDAEATEVVGLLHDMLERRNPLYCVDIFRDYGIPTSMVNSIVILTRNEGETYYHYIMRIIASGDIVAVAVKLADLNNNLASVKEGSMKDKYRFARHLLTNYFGILLEAKP